MFNSSNNWIIISGLGFVKSKPSFNNDPYLRKEPYRKIYLDEENMKFNPMNEQNPNPTEKDETHS